jgi:Fe-S-cluster containining protein
MPGRVPLGVVTSCRDCGVCCLGQAGLPVTWYRFIEPDAPLPPEVRAGVEALAGRDFWEADPCVWYDLEARSCRHYEWRPDVCRSFAVGGADCLRVRATRLVE